MKETKDTLDVDIINVAGLLIDHGTDRLEGYLREKLNPRWMKTFAPAGLSSVLESPEDSIQRTVDFVNESIPEIEAQFGQSRIVLLGGSNGGFTALLAACRLRFEKIFRVIAIEAPINPDVRVSPPGLMPHLHACVHHYGQRPAFATEAVETMRELGTGKVVVISNTHDDIVPPDAQRPVGDFDVIELSEGQGMSDVRLSGDRGSVVVLPKNIIGRGDGWRGRLPQGYRNHLAWSPEKYDLIMGIVGSALGKSAQEGEEAA
ncbi:MAG: hypothetical protein AAB592_00740 [Patescibacteria group bacterium]